MSSEDLKQKLKHITSDLTLSLRQIDSAYRGAYVRVREKATDTEEDIYMNYNMGFIDDDATISDGVTTIADWLTAMGTTMAYIVNWYNIGGKSEYLAQGTSSLQPELVLGGAGVLAKPMFSSSMMTTWAFASGSFYSPSTVFFVYQSDAGQSQNHTIFTTNSVLNADAFAYRYRLLPTAKMSLHYHDSANVNRVGGIENPTNNNLNLISSVFDGVTGGQNYYNGALKSNIAFGFKARYDLYRLGQGSGGFTGYYNGYIAEVIVIRKELTDTEREEVEREIINFYGIV